VRDLRIRIRNLVTAVTLSLLAGALPANPTYADLSPVQISTITVPSQMEPLQPFNPTTFSMSLFMTFPTSNGGSLIEEIQFIAYPGGITHSIFPNLAELQEWWIPTLVSGTTYSFTVRARNAVGWSIESTRSISIATLGEPPAPRPSTPTQLVSQPAPQPPANPVPIPSSLDIKCANSQEPFTAILYGERLMGITTASVDGKSLVISDATDSSLKLSFPALAAGTYDMIYGSSYGSVTQIGALKVCDAPVRPKPTLSPTVSPTTSPTLSPTVSPTNSPVTQSVPIKSSGTVFFAADSARLTSAARATLRALADDHFDSRSSYFVVEGFAARSSSIAYARALAMRRAQAVVEYLRSIGIDGYFKIETYVSGTSSSSGQRRAEISATSRR
jgi:OmpA-OmpF porin, OOP family